MYVDKKLQGVECVQTLSRLNRVYPGKKESGTFVLDFFNEPEDVLKAFQEYYQTAELIDVSNPNLIFDLSEKLRAFGIFQWSEVERFCDAYLQKSKSNAAIANICKPAVERWSKRYKSAVAAHSEAVAAFAAAKESGDDAIIANADKTFKACKLEKDALELFKKDLTTFVRFYEFISQIVDYDDKDLEKLSLFARNLGPLLREVSTDEDSFDLDNVALSHYRLSKIKQQNLGLVQSGAEGLKPGTGLGTGVAKDKTEEFLSLVIQRLNDLFAGDDLTDDDMLNYARTVSDKVRENSRVMTQIDNNTREQAMLGDFLQALDNAVLDSAEAHQKQQMRILTDSAKRRPFADIIYDLLRADRS
jgi:type I restriction enzyme R subunit